MLNKINREHQNITRYTDDELLEVFEQICRNFDSLDNIRNNIYALVKEVFIRKLNIVPYDEQLMSAIAMSEDNIAEMKTGEGKTVAAVFVSILYSLAGQVHVVTVNDYLAERDYMKMVPIYDFFKISCIANTNNRPKNQIYGARVVYTSSSRLIFDFLTEEIKERKEEGYKPIVQLDTAILDEIDFILLDNANSNFTVSEGTTRPFKYLSIYKIINYYFKNLVGGEINNRFTKVIDEGCLQEVDYIFSKNEKYVELTERGINKFEDLMGVSHLTSHLVIYQAILYTIEAHVLYKKDVDYIISNGKICLISDSNGRIMNNSHKEFGLQQAIEIKEKLQVTGENPHGSSMTYQLFFNKYKKLTGMSGTVHEAEDEFKDIFNLSIFIVPPHRASKRIDLPIKVFIDKHEKYDYLFLEVSKYHKNKQPILIVTDTESESMLVYHKLVVLGYRTQILINQTAKEEEQIIRNAGTNSTITITTNMAGRGTDISIDDLSVQQGGLVVLSLNKFNSIRVDHQVKGRAGRQGQPGITQTLSSLDDDIWSNLDTSIYSRMITTSYGKFYSMKYQIYLRNLLVGLQNYINSMYFIIRKQNYEFDKIIYYQKQYIYRYPKVFISDLEKNVFNIIAIELDKCMAEIKEAPIVFLGHRIDKNLSYEENLNITMLRYEKQATFIGDMSKDLIKSLLHLQVDTNINELITELTDLKYNIQGRALDLKQQLQTFIRESDQLLKTFFSYITLKSLDYFLIAKPERKQVVNL